MILQYTKHYNLRKTEEYKHLSRRAVEVFNLLLDRYQSSVKNGYSDENGTYVKYGQKEMAWDLDCEDRTIRNAIRQLEESGLVKTVRQFKRQVNKMYLNIPEKLTPLKNPIREAKKAAKKMVDKVVEAVKPKQQEDNVNAPKVVNVSNEVKTVLQEKLNLQADAVIQDLEEKFGKNEVIACINYVYNKIVIGKKQPIKSTKYLMSTFENGFNSKCGGNRVVRQELVPDWLKTQQENGDGWNNFYAPEKPKRSLTDEDLKKIEYMKQLQAELLKQQSNSILPPFIPGTIGGKI